MTYHQRIRAIAEASVREAAQRERDERESRRKLSLSEFDCFNEGWERGIEDAGDNYTGALDRLSTLGNDYAYPDRYRGGYVDAYYSQKTETPE